MDAMHYLAEDHPDLVTITKIGESYLKNNKGRTGGKYPIPEGGHDIFVVKITDSSSDVEEKGQLLVTSGLHAREYAPPELVGRFLETLVHGYDVDADITTTLKRTVVHAVLYVNPDGRWMAERYKELFWRKNLNPDGGCKSDEEYGVDLNRNFDFFFGDRSGASSNPCESDYHGPRAESEPETQAVADYARRLFPAGQRKADPEGEKNKPFREDNTGVYVDVHASGGYVYYPWGNADAKSPNNDAMEALGRKVNSFNGYKLWAGGQDDFLYPASGDQSDYAYGVLGVATFGLELGDDFYQECTLFEDDIVPKNLPALLYAAKIAHRPFLDAKGPDVLSLDAKYGNGGEVTVSARASDSALVNTIGGKFDDFATGDQKISDVTLYVDVHPEDYRPGIGAGSWTMPPTRRRELRHTSDDIRRKRVRTIKCSDFTAKKRCKRHDGGGVCEWDRDNKTCKDASASDSGDGVQVQAPQTASSQTPEEDAASGVVDVSSPATSSAVQYGSGDETVRLTFDASDLSPGKHTIYVQATDSDGYKGPVASLFVDAPLRRRESALRGGRIP